MRLMKAFSSNHRSWYHDIIILALFTGILFFIFLGSRPLSVPDEGNYAEIIREMFETNNYITPYLNGIKFFEKPILLYWLGAFAIKIGGVNLWSIRAVNASLAILICLMTYFISTKLYNRSTGLIASIILSTAIIFFSLGHMLTTDMVVTAFITLTLFTFLLGINETTKLKQFWYLSFTAIFTGLGVLAKGLIGIVLPMLIILLWICMTKEWNHLKNKWIPWCIFLILVVALPWHLLVISQNPEFWYVYFIEHHLLRFATNTVGHPQPFWYYVPVLLIGFFPWICFAPQSIKHSLHIFICKKEKYQIDIFFMIWAFLVLIFFTVATSKLVAYILPAFPPLAILTAKYLAPKLTQKKYQSDMTSSFFILFLLGVGISAFLLCFPFYWKVNNLQESILFSRLGAFTLCLGLGISFLIAKRKNYLAAFLNTTLTMSIFLIISLMSISAFDGQSIKPLTDILKTHMAQNDEIIAYNHHYQDLPFYLAKKINILNSNKLFKYGMRYQNHHEWMIKDDDFQKMWSSKARAFAFMRNEEFNNAKIMYPSYHFYILGKTNLNVLVSNKP